MSLSLPLQSGVLPKNSFSFYLSTQFSQASALVLGGVNSNYYTGNFTTVPFNPLQVSILTGRSDK